jgi:hypothetical protein
MNHYITKCSCGTVLSQCRCPSPVKSETIIKDGCAICHKTAPLVQYQPSKGLWHISKPDGTTILLTKDEFDAVHSVIHDYYHGED